MKKNDYSISDLQREDIRTHADRLLKKASAYGVFPTPTKDIIAASGLSVKYIQDLLPADCDAPESVKRALSKLEGFLHREEKTIYIEKGLGLTRRKFISIHEVAHHWLPEHQETYQILEDSATELDEETRDDFERAANCFSSDVLFQLDQFTMDAMDCPFGIGSPVKLLSKRFGAGNYSTIRRYTQVCGRPAAVLVCDLASGSNAALRVRRFIPSQEFERDYGEMIWPEILPENGWFWRNKPKHTFLVPTPWVTKTPSGERLEFIVEGFDSKRNIFFLIYPEALSS